MSTPVDQDNGIRLSQIKLSDFSDYQIKVFLGLGDRPLSLWGQSKDDLTTLKLYASKNPWHFCYVMGIKNLIDDIEEGDVLL
jgi:hypothetical protein